MRVGIDQVADFFAVSERTIRRWTADGMPSIGSGRDREFDVSACVEWKLEEARRRALAKLDSDSSTDAWKAARARKESALADRHELEARDRALALVDAGDVRQAFRGKVERVRSALIAWPAELAPGLAKELDVDAGALEAALAEHMSSVIATTDHLLTTGTP